MDLSNYRASDLERSRTADIASMFPLSGTTALDIGARDGHFSKILAERFESVTALDLELPIIETANVECVVGDIWRLEHADSSFDLVWHSLRGALLNLFRSRMQFGFIYYFASRIARQKMTDIATPVALRHRRSSDLTVMAIIQKVLRYFVARTLIKIV